MIRTLLATVRFLTLAIVFSVPFAGTGDASASELRLRSNISVTDDVIRIGDMFENAGRAADIAIFRSPAPGKLGVLTPTRVAYALRNHGLRWRNAIGVSEVTINRAGRVIPLTEIEDAIKKHLEASEAIPSAGEIALSFDRRTTSLTVSEQATAPVEVLQVNYDSRTKRFAALIQPPGAQKRRYVGRITEVVNTPVLKNTIERGHRISRSDIELRRLSRARINASVILNANSIIGHAASRTLKAGVPIRKRDIRQIRMVKKSATVTIVYKIPGLSLSTRGRAIQHGSRGDTIMVMNLRSRKMIEAEVIGPDTVRAIDAAPRKSAALGLR